MPGITVYTVSTCALERLPRGSHASCTGRQVQACHYMSYICRSTTLCKTWELEVCDVHQHAACAGNDKGTDQPDIPGHSALYATTRIVPLSDHCRDTEILITEATSCIFSPGAGDDMPNNPKTISSLSSDITVPRSLAVCPDCPSSTPSPPGDSECTKGWT